MRPHAMGSAALIAAISWWSMSLSTGCEDVQRPLESAVELRLQQVYDAREWLERVPPELAVSLYARSKLRGFVRDLELPSDVEARLVARIEADDFVDELVPFLLFVREIYQPGKGEGARTFDDHVRAHFSAGDDIPGMEHTHFQWTRAAREHSGEIALPSLAPEVARQLVSFYDVLYLRDQGREAIGEAHLGDRLACESRADLASLERATKAAAPSIRGLLEAFADAASEQGDLAAAIRGVLDDESPAEAATAALIRFVDQSVCRHYRFFAARAFRARQLEGWMKGELEAPGGGALWEYLRRAQEERRYGVVVVVDGLQGRLVEALARGMAGDPFLSEVAAEMTRAGGAAPHAKSLRAAPAQATGFLARVAAGFDHPHYLSFFKSLLASPQTRWVPVGVSTTPTISVRNIPIALTGAPVAGEGATGLPNFHFVDREFVAREPVARGSEARKLVGRDSASHVSAKAGEPRGRAYYFYGSDAVELTALTERAGMRTLFDRLPDGSSMSCNVQYDDRSQYGIDALVNLALGEKVRDFGERLCAAELDERARNERTLQALRKKLLTEREALLPTPAWQLWSRFGASNERALAERWIEQIAQLEQQAMPELLVVYNPWPDHFAHFEGPFSDAILSPTGELNRLDYWLGRITQAYEDAGTRERAVFGMAGDHGLTPVFHLLNPEVEVFDALREEGVNFRLEKISSDEGEGPKLTNPFDPPTMKGIDVVVASTAGGNYMLDLFVDQAEQFTRQPLASELRALRPLATPNARPIDLLDELATRLADSLDYLAVRDAPSTPEGGTVLLLGTRDGVRAEARIQRQGDRLHLAFEGADLLGTDRLSPYERSSEADRTSHAALRKRCLGALADLPSTWCNEGAWRLLTSYTARPDAVVQLGHLYDSERAGTINLFPRDGVGYNSVVPGRHAGESFHEKNAFVAIWGSPLSPLSDVPALRSAVNGAMPMAIYQYLSQQRPKAGEDGWGHAPFPSEWLPR